MRDGVNIVKDDDDSDDEDDDAHDEDDVVYCFCWFVCFVFDFLSCKTLRFTSRTHQIQGLPRWLPGCRLAELCDPTGAGSVGHMSGSGGHLEESCCSCSG